MIEDSPHNFSQNILESLKIFKHLVPQAHSQKEID
jgi:hypothetical protein